MTAAVQTIRRRAALGIITATLAGLLLTIRITAPPLTLTGLYTVLFMMIIGIGTLGTFGMYEFLLWLAPDRTRARRWLVRTMLFMLIIGIGTLGILQWLAPHWLGAFLWLIGIAFFAALGYFGNGLLFSVD